MKMTSLYLTEKQMRDLKRLSEQTGLPVAEHIRRAVDAYLLKHRKEFDHVRKSDDS